MTPATRARLAAGGLDRLADVLLDDVLDRPLAELLERGWLAREVAAALARLVRAEDLPGRLATALREARGRAAAGRVDVPPELRAPLVRLVELPYVPDRALVGRILDHEGTRLLLRGLFDDVLVSFASKLRAPLPGAKAGGGLGGALGKLGGGVLGVVGQEFERHVEHRAREFMDVAVFRLVERLADQVCAPERAPVYGEFRRHALDTVLDTDARTLAGELGKLDVDAVADTTVELLRAVVAREDFVAGVDAALAEAWRIAGDRPIRALLGEAEAEGTAVARRVFRERARALLEQPAFVAWWDEMNAGGE